MIGKRLTRYKILEELGRGRMGIVYRALDLRLDREVALKVLPPELVSDPERRRRFFQEARAAAAVEHPHIAAIHDIDEADGVTFIVMELLRGKELADLIGTELLKIDWALHLATEIAEGLSRAHQKGIVHRDLKPSNVFVTEDGHAKIIDFGVAKLLEKLSSGDSVLVTLASGETTPGGVVGTVSYMSPEQLRGADIDQRSDIFAFGAVLYEMLAGAQAFQRRSPVDVITAILTEEAHLPPLGADVSEDLLSELRDVLGRCLAKDRTRRCQTMDEVIVELRRVRRFLGTSGSNGATATNNLTADNLAASDPAAAGTGVSQAPGLGRGLRVAGPATQVGEHVRRHLFHIQAMAVLPLRNLSGDPEQEYFSDGMTEALIAHLGKLGAIKVISRTSAMSYKGTSKTLPEIARELRVDAVIEGSVLRWGDRIRITAQLVDAATDSNLWAESYERELHDVIALQGEVAKAIAREIKIRLTPTEAERLDDARVVDPAAYEEYLKGCYHWNKRTSEGIRQGMEHFKSSIEKDPTYAPPYAGLAESYVTLVFYLFAEPQEGWRRARAAALRALELDENLADAHTAVASSKAVVEWDWAGAERDYRRAISLNPSNVTAQSWYAHGLLTPTGRSDEAITCRRRAEELDPLSAVVAGAVGWDLYMARRYEETIEQEARALDLSPHFPPAHFIRGWALEQLGRFDEALASFETANQLFRSPLTLGILGHGYAVSGQEGKALEAFEQLREQSKGRYVSGYDLALIQVGLGRRDEAFEWLETAFRERAMWLLFLKVDPRWDPLRTDPRFAALLRRMHLDPEATGALAR